MLERSARNQLIILCASISSFLGAMGVTAQPIYRATDIGTLGGAWTHPTAISSAGHIVGDSDTGEVDGQGYAIHHAFIWKDGRMTDLGTLGELDSTAIGVNSQGQVVGNTFDGNYITYPFLWLPKPAYGLPAGMNKLYTASCGLGAATAINELGQVSGVLGCNVLLWLPDPAYGLRAGMNLLTDYEGCDSICSAYAGRLNDLGQIASFQSVWLPIGAYGLPPGWTELWPFFFNTGFFPCDINNSGLIDGYSYDLGDEGILIHDLASGKDELLEFGCGCGVNDSGEMLIGRLVRGPSGSFDAALRVSPVFHATIECTAGINNAGQIAAASEHNNARAFFLDPIDFDFDNDGAADLGDFDYVSSCMNGPGGAFSPACQDADLDRDGDVDLVDVHLMMWGAGTTQEP